MAGAAEGVWLDSESIHPPHTTVRSAGLDSTGGGVLVICGQVLAGPLAGMADFLPEARRVTFRKRRFSGLGGKP